MSSRTPTKTPLSRDLAPVSVAIDAGKARAEILREFRAQAGSNTFPDLQAYLGSPYPVLGLTTPQMRSVMREFRAANRRVTSPELHALAKGLWSGRTYEEKAFAISLLDAHPRLWNDVSWKLADGWVDRAIGWALSDSLAAGPIAGMVYPKPGRFQEVLRWTKAEPFWRRRASAYALHDFVLAGALDKPFQLLERLLLDEEFWVQRAVGTWLRESWKKDQRRTESFLRKHVRGLPKVVITVATERAQKAFREELRRKR